MLRRQPQILLFFLAIILAGSNRLSAGNVDSLLSLLPSTTNDFRLAELNKKIGEAYFSKEQYEVALQYYEISWELFGSASSLEKYELLYKRAHTHQKLSNYQEALELLFEYIKTGEEFDVPKERASALSRIASIYQALGDYDLSYNYHLKALGLVEAMRDTMGIARATYEIGTVFYYQENYTAAIDQYLRTNELFSEIGNDNGVYATLAAMGSTYERLGEMEKSLEYNIRSLKLAEELEYQAGIGYALNNIGTNYKVSRKFDLSHDFFRRSLNIKKELNDKWGLVGTYRNIAELKIAVNQEQEALMNLDSAMALANEIGSKPRILELLELYSTVHQKTGDYKSSLEYMQSYLGLKDSVLNETTLREMGQRKTRFEVQKREKEILLLKKENEILESKEQIDTLYNYIFFATALFLALMLVMVVSRFRTQKNNNNLLADKNREINQKHDELQHVNKLVLESNHLLEDKNDQIELQNKKLEDSNEDLRNFASVASHDLKEPLRMINAYTNILNKRYNNLFDEDATEFMGYIIDAVSRMEGLLNGLLDYSRVSIGEDQKRMLEIRDIIDLVQGNLKFPILKNEATIKINYNNLPRVEANQTQLLQLFQNLISNAIKFKGEAKPIINIDCSRKGDFHLFTIRDNGIGIKKEYQDKIFEMFRRLHSKEEYEGTGIGLATCKKIVDRHGGQIWVESTYGEGCLFSFTLPVVKALEKALVG